MNKFYKLVASLMAKGFANAEEKGKVVELFKALSTEEQGTAKPQADAAGNLPDEKPKEDEADDNESKTRRPPAGDDEDKVDEKAVTALIQKSVSDAVSKKMEGASEEIMKNFFAGVAEQRKKALDTGEDVSGDKDANDKTRKFIKALFAKDREVLKALSTGTADDGGYTIPAELQAEVLRIAAEAGVARREMRYLPFTGPGNSRKIPALGAGIAVHWTGEGEKKLSSQPAFTLVEQTLKKLTAMVPMTEEIIEDSGINLTQLVGELIAEAIAIEEDAQFFAGTGTPWTGILNTASVPKVTMVKVATGVTADDLLDLQDAVPSSAQNGAKYFMHRSWLSKVRKLKSSTGEYIYNGPSDGQPGTLWDKPVVTVDGMPSVSDGVANGAQFIIYGNLKQGAIFSDKQQLRVKLLEEATITDTDGSTTINLAEQDMVALRAVERVGYVVALPTAMAVLEAGATP